MEDNYLYLIHDKHSLQTAIVDPAVKDPVLEECEKQGWTLTHILNTHHHWDHTGANKALKAETGCEIIGFEGDAERIPGIDRTVKEGDKISLGSHHAQIFEVPGHTSGHIAFYFENSKALFIGDTLFAMGCGRLFEGTPQQMWSSFAKFINLPDETVIYCAHEYTQSNGRFALTVEPENTDLINRMVDVDRLRTENKPTVPFLLGLDKATNPFLRPNSAAIREKLDMKYASDAEVFGMLRSMKDNF
ncbi:hydroxyacylglutathione hydrolase [Temperatibacter marinus]